MENVRQIFLLDDDKTFNLIHTRLIRSSGYERKITSFTDGNIALSAVANALLTGNGDEPDLIFLDIHMPRMNGWEFVERLDRLLLPTQHNCIVYMLSSKIDDDEVKKAEAYPMVYGMIRKPFTVSKLKMLYETMRNAEFIVDR